MKEMFADANVEAENLTNGKITIEVAHKI